MLKSLFTLRDGAGLTVQQQQQQHGASVVSLAALSASSNYGHYGGHEPSHHHHHHHHGGGGGGASGSGGGGGAHSPGKYQENGHDTFSDFVTLVCQEAAQNTQNSPQVNWNYVYSLNSSAKIPSIVKFNLKQKVNQPSGRVKSSSSSSSTSSSSSSSYHYSTNMLPPPPPPVMARPVAIIRSTGKSFICHYIEEFEFT